MWHVNKKVIGTYSTYHARNSWANIESVGWRKIGSDSSDAVTNAFVLLNSARANDRLVTIWTDGDNKITRAYLK